MMGLVAGSGVLIRGWPREQLPEPRNVGHWTHNSAKLSVTTGRTFEICNQLATVGERAAVVRHRAKPVGSAA